MERTSASTSNYKYCVVPECRNSSSRTPNKIFVSLPGATSSEQLKRRKLWLEAMRRKEEDFSKNTNSHVCQDHFNLEEDMENYIKWKLVGGYIIMKKNIVPHIFQYQPARKRTPPPPERRCSIKRSRKETIQLLEDVNKESQDSVEVQEELLDKTRVSNGHVFDDKFRNDRIKSDEIEIKMEYSAEETEITYGEIYNVNTDATNIALAVVKEEPCEEEIKTEMEEQLDNSAPSNSDLLDYKYKNDMVMNDVIKMEFSEEDTVITYDKIANVNAEETDIGLTEVKEEPCDVANGIEDNSYKHQDKIKEPELDTSRPTISVLNTKGFHQSSNLKNYAGRKQYKCDLCDKLFLRSINLIKHRKYGHTKEQYKCDICEKKFSLKRYLKKHTKIHIGESRFGESSELERFHKCDLCPKVFLLKAYLWRHMRSHTTEKQYKCDVCEKKFSLDTYLKRHVKIHLEEKQYHCEICGKKFTLSSSLAKHIKVHTREKSYKCDVCEKMFLLNSYLQNHMRLHTGEKQYKCEICGKTFSLQSNYSRHVKLHTGVKPYKCDICEKRFTRKDLRCHMRQHSGEKPFTCRICGKSFTQKHSLLTHIGLHTGGKSYECKKKYYPTHLDDSLVQKKV